MPKKQHKPDDIIYYCPECDTICEFKSEIIHHMQEKHETSSGFKIVTRQEIANKRRKKSLRITKNRKEMQDYFKHY